MKVSQSTASDEWDGREAAAACVIRQWDVLSKGVLVAALQHAPPYHLIVVKVFFDCIHNVDFGTSYPE